MGKILPPSNENENRQRQPPLQSETTGNYENESRQSQPPSILTIHYRQQGKHTIYRPVDGKSHIICTSILIDKYVVASTHGWLVLTDKIKQDCCLWNPDSKDVIKLPRLQKNCFYSKCVLSKPPTEPDCHILFTSDDLFQQAFCKIGDVEFVYQSQIKEVERLIGIASSQGKIYGVMIPDFKFVTIEFVGRTIEFRPILINGEQPLTAPVIEKNWVVRNVSDLIDSHTGNELLFVVKDLTQNSIMDGSEFTVFRVDINRMECIEVDDIGDQVILIGQCGTGFCCSSSGTTFKPNSIYYIREYERCVYVFDLDDKSTVSWLPNDVGYVLNHFWVDVKLE
ncbi:hypothetical protein CASFOL_016197 [Castilleja foliolosa]|uniref:KIB1-4 beta-propeller domain-containing protein n=1 Tax=Castilleja foliolosa TaxID=1961234 RepID=A0ABD3DJN5_9LAMI